MNVLIEIDAGSSADKTELDELTRQLLMEIEQDVDVEDANVQTKEAPPGTRSVEAITIGMLVLSLLPVVVDKLADLLMDWARRNESTVTLTLNNMTIEYNPRKTKPDELKQIIRDAMDASQGDT
jgi:hypothetical protein